jgi:hypothetical protein
MGCFSPLEGWRSKLVNESGRRSIVFKESSGNGESVTVPCGRCIGCRLDRSKEWAIRCVHEASLHQDNCFITLTYNDAHLPPGGTLVKRDFQLFMKRLRKKYGKVRYYMCGEYGSIYDERTKLPIKDSLGRELIGRPHFHACLFGFDFGDKTIWRTKNGVTLYRSVALDNLWSDKRGPIGYTSVGSVTYESAAYVARYVTKKMNGDLKDDKCARGVGHYERLDEETGEITECVPEYTNMSRRPGIAKEWLKKYHKEVYANDSVLFKFQEAKVPRYYDQVYDDIDGIHLEEVKDKRLLKALDRSADDTYSRQRQKRKVKDAQFKKLQREL